MHVLSIPPAFVLSQDQTLYDTLSQRLTFRFLISCFFLFVYLPENTFWCVKNFRFYHLLSYFSKYIVLLNLHFTYCLIFKDHYALLHGFIQAPFSSDSVIIPLFSPFVNTFFNFFWSFFNFFIFCQHFCHINTLICEYSPIYKKRRLIKNRPRVLTNSVYRKQTNLK